MEVESYSMDLIEIEVGAGTSVYQAFQEFLTLDGGRPYDVFANVTPIDGGTEATPHVQVFERVGVSDLATAKYIHDTVADDGIMLSEDLELWWFWFGSLVDAIDLSEDVSEFVNAETEVLQEEGFSMEETLSVTVGIQPVIEDGFHIYLETATDSEITELDDDTVLMNNTELADE